MRMRRDDRDPAETELRRTAADEPCDVSCGGDMQDMPEKEIQEQG